MKKFVGTKYNSRWDGSTWFILAFVMVCCTISCILNNEISSIIISLTTLAFVVVIFFSIYYRIDGNKLVVYRFFIPTAYPIDKIKEIKSTQSILSAPATSLSHRLAISFTDRKILKSAIPLIISPVRQQEFIQQLLAINPHIRHSTKE